MRQLVKVMPLSPGLTGLTAQGVETALVVGTPGWMDLKDVPEAEASGSVMRMAGSTPQAIQQALYIVMSRTMRPDLETQKPTPAATPEQQKREYRTRAVKAE